MPQQFLQFEQWLYVRRCPEYSRPKSISPRLKQSHHTSSYLYVYVQDDVPHLIAKHLSN